MITDQHKQVNEFIFTSLESEGLESCRLFTNENGVFSTLKSKKITSPKTYRFYAAKWGHSELASFASKLCKIPASTAQLERLFSNWSFVHSVQGIGSLLTIQRSCWTFTSRCDQAIYAVQMNLMTMLNLMRLEMIYKFIYSQWISQKRFRIKLFGKIRCNKMSIKKII